MDVAKFATLIRFVPLPKALNFSDIESDSSSWKNVEYAHYFNKKAIVLKKP
mgnify:CR=1 FL=1